jgi:hypothetical protein
MDVRFNLHILTYLNLNVLLSYTLGFQLNCSKNIILENLEKISFIAHLSCHSPIECDREKSTNYKHMEG